MQLQDASYTFRAWMQHGKEIEGLIGSRDRLDGE
jgi:hypothetical protein